MNNEINIPLPKISDFPRLSDSFLERFSAVYMPDMSRAELKTCQNHYLRHRRTPSGASELAFLNALAKKKHSEPDGILVSEMTTDDPLLAETFADLMAKRAAVTPDYQMPCSLAEIPKIAQKYLAAHAEKKDRFRRVSLSADPRSMLALSTQKTTPSLLCGDAQNGFAGGVLPSHALAYSAPPADNDAVYALLKSTDPTDGFEEKLLNFTTSPLVQTRAKRLCPIGKNGVFTALTSLNTGFEVDLTRLYGEKTTATHLLESEVGVLLAIKESEAAPLLIEALDAGLRPRLVGHLRKDERVLLAEGAGMTFYFSLRFLDSFACSRAYRAEMNPPSAPSFSPVALEETSAMLGKNKTFSVRVSTDATRNAALYASIHAVAACVAHGATPKDIRIAERFLLATSDTSPEAIGTPLSLLVSAYRAVTEFELSALDTVVLADEKETNFSLCATIYEPESPTPHKLISNHSFVYLLEPQYDENGNPDFDDIKKMLEYVRKLKRDGKLFSAKAVVGDLIPTLEEMSENCLAEYVLDAPYSALPGSILVETGSEIEGLLVAKTYAPEPETAPTAETEPEVTE